MFVETQIIVVILSFLSTVTLACVGFILKSVMAQGAALGLLVHRVGTFNNELVDRRLLELEGDMVQVWAWKQLTDKETSSK